MPSEEVSNIKYTRMKLGFYSFVSRSTTLRRSCSVSEQNNESSNFLHVEGIGK